MSERSDNCDVGAGYGLSCRSLVSVVRPRSCCVAAPAECRGAPAVPNSTDVRSEMPASQRIPERNRFFHVTLSTTHQSANLPPVRERRLMTLILPSSFSCMKLLHARSNESSRSGRSLILFPQGSKLALFPSAFALRWSDSMPGAQIGLDQSRANLSI